MDYGSALRDEVRLPLPLEIFLDSRAYVSGFSPLFYSVTSVIRLSDSPRCGTPVALHEQWIQIQRHGETGCPPAWVVSVVDSVAGIRCRRMIRVDVEQCNLGKPECTQHGS